MTALHDTLEQVRARIAQYEGKDIGEQNTKAALINPVLRSLGWDLEDRDEVQFEYLPALVVAALQAHRARQATQAFQPRDGLVFSSRSGRPLSGTSVTHQFQALLSAAGLPRLRFHDLRHTHAALLIHLGVQPRLIMERLGHASIVTTMNVYGHIMPAAGREAARALDQMFNQAASG